jgi:hypothetical protein
MITKKSLLLKWGLSAMIAALCLLAFQNCGKQFAIAENSPSVFLQQTQACFGNSAVDACIYQKSAVAEAGAAVDTGAAHEYQSYGVQLSELDTSGSLTSSSFVVSSGTSRAQKKDGSWKYSFADDPQALAQVAAYYYLTDFKNNFKNRTGVFQAQGKAIKVNVGAGFAGWSDHYNEIDLENQDDKIPMALDAGLVVNLLAHANAYYASGGQIETGISTYAQTCANKKGARVPYSCCTSAQGCGPALVAGQADYMTAVYFSSLSTTLGETWSSLPEGISTCSVSRDVSRNSNLTAAQAYAACSGIGASGNIYSLGALYASIWWETRKKVSDKNNFDLFFLRHLEVLSGDDTFTTIQSKLQTLDQSSFSSRYYSLMHAEFQRRGL